MRPFLASVVVLTACGSDGGASLPRDGGGGGSADAADTVDAAGGTDAGTDAPADAPSPPPSCNLATAWGTPTAIPGVNSTAKDVYGSRANDLTLYFSSDRSGGGGASDLYTATRATTSDSFGSVASIAGFNSSAEEAGPVLTADELTLFYQLASGAGQNNEIYVATRASKGVGFSSGAPVTPVNDSSSDDGDVTVTADGGQMFFASNRNSATGYDIFVSIRGGNGVYGAPAAVTEVNTNVYDAHPHVSPDGLVLYWSSMRTDGGAEGGTDVWMASRTTASGTFGTPVRVDELSTASNESPTWVSSDGCLLYLQSNRTGTLGGNDLWEATKPLP